MKGMKSPYMNAEFVGGPLDGTTYERRDEKFPRRLPIQVGRYVELYVARLGRLATSSTATPAAQVWRW